MAATQNDIGLGTGGTVEFELAGYAGELGRYRFYAQGRDITRALADRMSMAHLPDGTIALEPYVDGPGQRFVRQVAKRLLGYENALYARQKAGIPGASRAALLALEASREPVSVPFLSAF